MVEVAEGKGAAHDATVVTEDGPELTDEQLKAREAADQAIALHNATAEAEAARRKVDKLGEHLAGAKAELKAAQARLKEMGK